MSALLIASRVLVGVSARSLAAAEDTVTTTQFRTLIVLHAHGPVRLTELADRLGVNASTAQRSVDRLVGSALVDRRENAADRREVTISLTREGARLVREVSDRRRAAIGEIVEQMPAVRRRALIEALEAFAAAADEPRDGVDDASRLGW